MFKTLHWSKLLTVTNEISVSGPLATKIWRGNNMAARKMLLIGWFETVMILRDFSDVVF